MRKFKPNMKYSDAQIKALWLFNKSLKHNEHHYHRTPHNHPTTERLYNLPVDLVIVDVEFAEWFHMSLPLFGIPDHVAVFRDEYYQLRMLLHEWERKSESNRAKWLKIHWFESF